ncbi:MAG: hypothetical protein M2R45_05308 [Verrucomicrobia subdivision 3 bacterium]|nr:hypothetical protein [Limisphaerales bacterium]MCS1414065.1 hypothetical protein [Limisphaerales bacterium]
MCCANSFRFTQALILSLATILFDSSRCPIKRHTTVVRHYLENGHISGIRTDRF